jgi:hypothetical protein
LAGYPDFPPTQVDLAIAYSKLGRAGKPGLREQNCYASALLFRWRGLRQQLSFKDQAVLVRFVAALRKAGLK